MLLAKKIQAPSLPNRPKQSGLCVSLIQSHANCLLFWLFSASGFCSHIPFYWNFFLAFIMPLFLFFSRAQHKCHILTEPFLEPMYQSWFSRDTVRERWSSSYIDIKVLQGIGSCDCRAEKSMISSWQTGDPELMVWLQSDSGGQRTRGADSVHLSLRAKAGED